MKEIKFNIDTTEDSYSHFDGKTVGELKEFLYPDRTFRDCCGTITITEDNRQLAVSVAAVKEYGVYIGIYAGDECYLSLYDRDKLEDVVDVWGDGLYVSQGLFISPELAWSCIRGFLETGERLGEIDWITPDDLPEEGNYI